MRRLEVLGPLWGFTEFNRFACPRCLSRCQRSVSLGRKVSQPRSGDGSCQPVIAASETLVTILRRLYVIVVMRAPSPHHHPGAEDEQIAESRCHEVSAGSLSSESLLRVVKQIHGDNGTERLVSRHLLAGFDNTSHALGVLGTREVSNCRRLNSRL